VGSIVVIHLLDNNQRRRWVFEWSGRDVVLQRYHLEEQRSASDYRLIEFFDGEDAGDDYGDWKWLEESEVPWDDELKGEVALAIVSRLKIRKPSEARSG
jgi:hypothetical protein